MIIHSTNVNFLLSVSLMTRLIYVMDEVNRWDSATKQLGDAIKEWSEISDELKEEPKVAPDKQLLFDVEELLKHLKSKLDEFNTPIQPTPAPIESLDSKNSPDPSIDQSTALADLTDK